MLTIEEAKKRRPFKLIEFNELTFDRQVSVKVKP